MASLLGRVREWSRRRRQIQVAGDNSVQIMSRNDIHLAGGLESLRAMPLPPHPSFPAQYGGGVCPECSEIIAAGDMFVMDGDAEIHRECGQ